MDQEKIGKFIATCRKNKNLTQSQLAEKFNITDRAVSKWETGKSLPDPSIMMPLCNILGINVNELLTGEKLNTENYKIAAEKNLLEQRKKEVKLRNNKIVSIILGLIIIITIISHFAINFLYPENKGTGMGEILIIISIFFYIWDYTLKKK